jgi:hypothetical protein
MKSFLSVFLLFFILLFGVSSAQAGDFFFPNIKKQIRANEAADNVDEELKAPFAAEDGMTETQNAMTIGGVALNLPNATDATITNWVSSAVTDALTFTSGDVQGHARDSLQYFTPAGEEQYIAFLRDSNIYQNLDSGYYQLNSAVQLEPLLVGEQESNGLYKWLYDVQVMLSYLNAGTTSYDAALPQNQTLFLRVQVTRAEATDENDMGVRIELWKKK